MIQALKEDKIDVVRGSYRSAARRMLTSFDRPLLSLSPSLLELSAKLPTIVSLGNTSHRH